MTTPHRPAPSADTPATLLDLTRLCSRVGRGPWTGVDRVEAAYLAHLLDAGGPLWALIRAAPGFVLLDRAGVRALSDRLRGTVPWGPADWIARAHLRQTPARRRVMADLRRLALGRCMTTRGLARLVARHVPARATYFNTGHSNLDARVFKTLAPCFRAVLVHDVIPLTHPQFTRPGVPEAFARKMQAVGAGADLVIYNSAASRDSARAVFARGGRVPQDVVAHLGCDLARPAGMPPELPAGMPDPSRPYFVTLGTIEPRKNHALLLDLWDSLAARLPQENMPALVIIGGRGWNNRAVFDRLDHGPLRGQHVFELTGLADGAVASCLQNARALLFPSHAEGFGLPVAEALALGTPVICNDLIVLRDVFGDSPVYARIDQQYQWEQAIIAALATPANQSAPRHRYDPPRWSDHFDTVFRAIKKADTIQ
ncbi:glycosyltransferase family 4 protein [Roseicitreum antarcticum]|nr:glycosyltransferase family 1 protein [Roseicitreum antarcticum]